jgi:fructokinase
LKLVNNFFTQMRTLSFGAILWDLIGGKELIGGAPFNVAAHLSRLGAESHMLTRIGNDRLGEMASAEMDRLGVSRRFVQTDPLHPTGWAKVDLDEQGKATFSFPEDPAYEFIMAEDAIVGKLRGDTPDTFCFGTLEQKGPVTRQTLMHFLENVPFREILYDINIRFDFYPADILRASLTHTSIVKFNDDEAPMVSMRLYGQVLTEKELSEQLLKEFPVRVVCITKGAHGCYVYSGGRGHDIPGIMVKVSDTVGSGDAFSAAFLKHYFDTGDPLEAGRKGNELGAWVASRPGAVPDET